MKYSKDSVLSLEGVRVFVDEKEIVKGVDLSIGKGEVHALMGPNGSGKSTLAAALMGHPSYRTEGKIYIDDDPIDRMDAFERSKAGLFLGFQYPVAIPGVTVTSFLRAAMESRSLNGEPLKGFGSALKRELNGLSISQEFASRYINDSFSGGEKKRLEILQMLMLEPKVAILDEIDSGLDIDALKQVAAGVMRAVEKGSSVLLVTHYRRILDYVVPDFVHVFMNGKIVRTGGPEQAAELEDRGYEWLSAPSEANP